MDYTAIPPHHIDDVALLFRKLALPLAPKGCVAAADLVAEDGSFQGEMAVPHRGFSREKLEALAEPAGFLLRPF